MDNNKTYIINSNDEIKYDGKLIIKKKKMTVTDYYKYIKDNEKKFRIVVIK